MQILEYLEAYTDHFGFRKNIVFRTEVMKVEQLRQGNFRVLIEVGFRFITPATLVIAYNAATPRSLRTPKFLWMS